MVQASEKGSSALTTGIIIGASPLCLVLVSPFFVSSKHYQSSVLTRTFTEASKVGSEVHIDIWDSTARWSFLSTRVRPTLTDIYLYTSLSATSLLCRFPADMPAGAVFIVFGIVLRMTEGVGWAMVKTTSLALLPYLFPSHPTLECLQ